MRGRAVAWRCRRICPARPLPRCGQPGSHRRGRHRAKQAGAIDEDRSAFGVAIPAPGRGDPVAGASRGRASRGHAEFREGHPRCATTGVPASFRPGPNPGVLHDVLPCKVPTLLVTGQQEMGDMHAANAALAAYMPQARARVAPGLGHGWIATRPDLHSGMVRAWLEDRPLPWELQPERTDWQQTRAGRRIAASAAELGLLARLPDDLRGIDPLAGWLRVVRVIESEETSIIAAGGARRSPAEPAMVAKPGTVGILAVQARRLFAG